MYHHHPQHQGSQPFSNGTRPTHQPTPNQHPNRTSSDVLSQVMTFQFPRPTQLPDELESALAIRGARDMDHRLMEHVNQQSQHQNKDTGCGISRHGSYSTNPGTVSSDNNPAHQQAVDWSSYQPPNKLFVSPSPSASHHSQPQPQSGYAGANITSLIALASDSHLPQARHGGSSGGGEGQSLYTAESAGSILASFGLSNEDLEVLSHYPDDQLTPDTLPFILRNIQINKSEKQKTVAPTTESSFSNSIQDVTLTSSHTLPLTSSRSPEVPSLLTVTQTAGKVIDYGHASRANDERSTKEAFKREPLSSERVVKMYPSSSSTPKVDKTERHQVNLEQTEPSKHGDQDYRRTTNNHCKSRRSPAREFPQSLKDRNLDQDYRRDRLKHRASSETKSEDSSRRSLSSSSDSKPISTSKKIPAAAMISDFLAVPPKVFPHTCSLCHTECNQEKDWRDHINTVNHTAACRDLRNKYPAWKPNQPSRNRRHGSNTVWDPKVRSPSQPISQSRVSPSSSPHRTKDQVPPLRPHGKPYSSHSHFHQHHYTERRFENHYSSKHSSYGRDHRPEKRKIESWEKSSRGSIKRTYDEPSRSSSDRKRQLLLSKQGPAQSSTEAVKNRTKTGTKSAKSPLTKKKKKTVTPSEDWSVAHRLVYLIGIPNDALEQEVTDLVGSFGKINNVILMPCSDEQSAKSEGQKASVCMVKAKDAEALANSTQLSIRGQKITALVAKKPDGCYSAANNSTPALGQDKMGAGEHIGGEAEQKISDEKGLILITGLPESCLETDITTLVQPFGTPSDIILAAQVGKVLVSVPDCETAQEIVKVHTFLPAKIRNKDVKIIHLKQKIGLSTPVALYNLLMGPLDPLESSSLVPWSSLLVISNVPSMSSSFEVQKLVQRFGTVIKTLVLKNMVICEMATAAMALSVYKRFQTFPCIIQNNPLFFSRKPDAKTQTKVVADLSEEIPTNVQNSQTAVVNKRQKAPEQKLKSHLKEMQKAPDAKEERIKNTEKMTGEENKSIDKNIKHEELTDDGSNHLALSDTTLEQGVSIKMEETSSPKNGLETLEDDKRVDAADTINDKTVDGEEEKPCSSNGEVDPETAAGETHKQVSQEMVEELVEGQTKIGNQPDYIQLSTGGEQPEIQMLLEHSEKETKKQKPSLGQQQEEKQRKDREARKEKEARERREKERRAKGEREQDERMRREREKREEERRERERRQRKRSYGKSFPGATTSFRSQGGKQSSWIVENPDGSKATEETLDEDFPFNISDFVTVDEVGDVTDLPCSLSAVTVETKEACTSVQPDTSGDSPTEAPGQSDEPVCEALSVVANTLDSPVANTSPEQPCSSPTAQQGNTSDMSPTDLNLTASLFPPESASEASLNCKEVPTSEGGFPLQVANEKGGDTANNSQAETEEVASHKTEEREKTQDEKGNGCFTETGSANQPRIRDECVQKVQNTDVAMAADGLLPPFDPSSPVGMEFLVPKTGFFCKVCNRFFSGNKEAEMNHCKTLKHYENLQQYLQKMRRNM